MDNNKFIITNEEELKAYHHTGICFRHRGFGFCRLRCL